MSFGVVAFDRVNWQVYRHAGRSRESANTRLTTHRTQLADDGAVFVLGCDCVE